MLTGKGVTSWQRTLAGLIPAATPPAAPATRAAAPPLPAATTRELINVLAAMTLAPPDDLDAHVKGRPDPC